MAILNIRPLIQTTTIAVNRTPIKPTHGCQTGIDIGVANRTDINAGVSGGKSDNQVANPASGVLATGIITNIGNITGNIDGNIKF